MAGFVGIQRGAALAGVEFVLLADEVLVVVDLRGEGVKAGLCGGEFGADAVDAFEREAGEVRVLDFLQAGFLGKQFVFDLGVVDLGVDEGEFVVVVKAGVAVGFVVVEAVVEFLAAGLQLVEALAVSLVGSGLAGFEVAFVVALVAGFEQGFLAIADGFGLGEDVFLPLQQLQVALAEGELFAGLRAVAVVVIEQRVGLFLQEGGEGVAAFARGFNLLGDAGLGVVKCSQVALCLFEGDADSGEVVFADGGGQAVFVEFIQVALPVAVAGFVGIDALF